MFEVTESVSNPRKIILITHPSVQANAFANYLTNLLSVSVDVHNINKPLVQRLSKGTVVLFDIAVSNTKLNGIWRDIIRAQFDSPRLLIINSAQKYELYEMAQWPALYGVFRHDDEESRLIEGVKAVLNGEQTAELSVMHPAMYAVEQTPETHDSVPLTERECEILNELRHGATNMDIARALFISEKHRTYSPVQFIPQIKRKKQNPGSQWAE